MPGFNKTNQVLTANVNQLLILNGATPVVMQASIEQPKEALTTLSDPVNMKGISPQVMAAFTPQSKLITQATVPISIHEQIHKPVVGTQIFYSPIFWPPVFIGILPRPRNQVTTPISPTGVVNIDTIFEDPADPNKKYALPLFNLAEQTVADVTHVRVSFERILPIDPPNQKWQLTVRFGVVKRRQEVNDLAFTPNVLLRFTPPHFWRNTQGEGIHCRA